MGLVITKTVNVAPVSELTKNSAAGVYVAKDGSVAIKGDSDGKIKNGRPAVPAHQVMVTSGKSGRTFIKDIAKLTDAYKYVGQNRQFALTPVAGFNPTVRW